MLTGSSIVKVVREAAIVVEAIVGELGGGQGSSGQGEKQNSLMTDYTAQYQHMISDDVLDSLLTNKKLKEDVDEKETSCMAGDGRDWESRVTTKDLSIGRTPNTPYNAPAHPESCWLMARWVGWTARKQDQKQDRKQDRIRRPLRRAVPPKKTLPSVRPHIKRILGVFR